jgi:CHRD domain
MNKLLLSLGFGVVVLAGCNMNSTPVLPTYAATMNGANERPAPVITTATGATTATLDGSTLTLNVSYTGLSGKPTLAHIHGPADESGTAPPICDFTNKIDANATGTGSLTATCILDGTVNKDLTVTNLNDGKLYVNVHTAANPGGEIRGQLKKQ